MTEEIKGENVVEKEAEIPKIFDPMACINDNPILSNVLSMLKFTKHFPTGAVVITNKEKYSFEMILPSGAKILIGFDDMANAFTEMFK